VGQRVQREGIGANVLGDPRLALTWLANELPAMGATLAAGHIITTGTCVVPMDIVPLDTVLMDFGVLGQVRCGFSGE
jgi:2-keto-4-pentenoate hydratase